MVKNILIVTVLGLIAVLLFFKVYDDYFAKPLQMIIGTIFPFILSFVIVYSLIPLVDMISDKLRWRRKIKKRKGKVDRNLAILLALIMFFSIFIYIILAFIPIVAKQLSGLIEFF